MVLGNDKPKPYSTFEAAQLLGVDMTTVIGWCKQKKLAAYKTPGGHRRIKSRDLVNFLKEYQMPIPAVLKHEAIFRALVVDDEAAVRNLVVRVLKEVDKEAEIEQAADGFEAGMKVLDILPQLVVLDLNLPGLDGFRVCKNIRDDDRFNKTRILAISDNNTSDYRSRILGAGANAFLPKPFTPNDFKEMAQKLFASKENP